MLKINKILSKKIKFPLSLRGAKRRGNLSGFSLIELMVAVVILALVILGIFLAFSTGFQGMADARDRTVAMNYAREAMEDIKNMDFESISPTDKEQIGTTKFWRQIIVQENIEGTPNLKKVTTYVFWEKRNGDDLNVETSMLINKIEFLADVASKLLLYATPYNIILPSGGSVNLIAVVKDAKGNTVTAWDEDITFTITGVTIDGVTMTGGELSCYLKNDGDEAGIGDSISVAPINGIAEIKLYTGKESTLEADQIGNINVEAQTTSVDEEVFIDSVDIKVTQGAVKIDLISEQDSIETNIIKINSNTEIIATLVDANGDQVDEGEAEIIFNVSGEGALVAPLTRTTIEQETSITLTASNTSGVATVIASANNLLPGTIDIYVTGPPKSIYVEVNPNYIYMGQTADVIVTLKDINGITVNAESDVNISFSLSPTPDAQGYFTPDSIIIPFGSSTNNSTTNSIFFTPTGTGNGIVQATATDLTIGEAAIIVADTLVADHIEVSASPPSIEAGGNTPSRITAVIKSAEPENDTVSNYSEDIIFTTDKGSFSEFFTAVREITLENTDDEYQNGEAWVNLYSDSGDTSGIASIIVTSDPLDEGTTEVGFYVEADHIELTSNKDTIDLFGVPDDTCTITATIKDINNETVLTYVGTVIFSIIDGGGSGQFITTGNVIVGVDDGGQASVDLRGQCETGDVRVRAVTTFGATVITTGPDDDLYVSVENGGVRDITLLEGSILQPSKNEVVFEINNAGIDLKIYNLQATWDSPPAKITEIKIDNIIVYSGSVSKGETLEFLNPITLDGGSEYEIYFTYSNNVNNNHFEIILNADPDCGLLEPIEFDT